MVTIDGKKYSLDTKITYKQPNPKKSGYAPYNRYKIYSKSTTLKEYFDVCALNKFKQKDIQNDLTADKQKGFLTITQAKQADVVNKLNNDIPMKLNGLYPAPGSKKSKKRVGRGIGSGIGKTCGRGHKGQKSRSGGATKIGFEGGQMPLQRRLPKQGFKSRKARITDQITLSEIDKLTEDIITIEVLKQHSLINKNIKRVKVILSGSINRKITLNGIKATKGALNAITNAGGSIN